MHVNGGHKSDDDSQGLARIGGGGGGCHHGAPLIGPIGPGAWVLGPWSSLLLPPSSSLLISIIAGVIVAPKMLSYLRHLVSGAKNRTHRKKKVHREGGNGT